MSLQQANPVASNAASQLPPQALLPLSFLNFPREIRDLIYNEIFKHQESFQLLVCTERDRLNRSGKATVFNVSYTKPQGHAEPSSVGENRPRGMSWMLTNKQTCQEAIEQFQREATWTVLRETFFQQADQPLSRWSIPNSHRRRRFQPCLLMPSEARNIVVQGWLRTLGSSELDYHGNAAWELFLEPNNVFNQLITELHGSTNLRTLSIALDIVVLRLYPPGTDLPVRVSLGHLPRLQVPSLQTLEVNIGLCDEFLDQPCLVDAFDAALDEAAATLLGGRARFTRGLVANPTPMDPEGVYIYTRI